MKNQKQIKQKFEDLKDPLIKVDFSEIEVKALADAIAKVSKAFEAINKTRLKRETLIVLIAHKSKLSQSTVELVINNLEQFEKTWLKPISK